MPQELAGLPPVSGSQPAAEVAGKKYNFQDWRISNEGVMSTT